MVWQLTKPLSAGLAALSALAVLALAPQATAEPLLRSEKQYRLAAWHFYQDDYYQALLQLALAPEPVAKTRLLQAGLLMQLDMPAATAALLQTLLADKTLSGQLPRQLRNVALLQFSRYLFEQQRSEQARHYLQQLTGPLETLSGQAELLNQLLNWPALAHADPQIFSRLAGQAELPYVVINHILALRQQQQPEQALQLLARLSGQLQTEVQPGFWMQLFRWRSGPQTSAASSEQQALADYLQLLQAGLLVDQLQWASAQQVLSEFASNSVLTLPAMLLYRDVLSENRQIPSLLAVLQQLIARYPYAPASWLAAHQLGVQFERALAQKDALAAYRWADHYYQQQLVANNDHAGELQLEQLAEPAGLSGWQQYQLRQQASLYQLNRQLNAMQQLQQLHLQRVSRLTHLTEVVQTKLAQQQQLLAAALPDLTSKQQQLQQQVAQLDLALADAASQPLVQWLWLDSSEQDFAGSQRMLSSALQRLALLASGGQEVSLAETRLARLQGLLQWHYQQNSAQRHWQLNTLRQQLAEQLSLSNGALQRLAALDGQTERLLVQQQQLAELAATEQQFSGAVAQQQQLLLAQLNHGLQQLRQTEREQLADLRRLNTQAIARVMEQLLLTSQEAQ
ncbi:hypothetical protein WG68_17380 [Arsukibacterium ikkense]|uniref:Uncharacterized protein n=1 Tax=Arsukibacterium ikkense TaxID=336831 RepID=A0A0M2V4J7_9GAMM|nr:hypothetical protein [Arsukibacterium ikkense]KKO44088.1 hypothetical protein WG68_17380 [Arsukibacterium ikkense]